MCMRDNLGDKKKKKKEKKHTPSVVVFFFCFVECIEVIFTHHLWLGHIAYMCLQGRKKFKNVNIWNGNRKINKWCFIKIFSKNAVAPQFVDFFSWSARRLADQLTIRTSVFSMFVQMVVWKVVKKCKKKKKKSIKVKMLFNRKLWHCDVLVTSLYQHLLHLWCFKASL